MYYPLLLLIISSFPKKPVTLVFGNFNKLSGFHKKFTKRLKSNQVFCLRIQFENGLRNEDVTTFVHLYYHLKKKWETSPYWNINITGTNIVLS